MPETTARFELRSLEPEVRRLWKSRRLPARGGVLGATDGPLLRQFEGGIGPGDPPELVAPRAVAADVDARHRVLSGGGVVGTLREERVPDEPPSSVLQPLLESLGIWTGGAGERPWDDADRHANVQSIVSRLAHREILAARDGPLRICISCGVPRSPERIVYQKEVGDTYLVRFPLTGTDPPVDALVWVDAPWRLLGASALLVHPDVPYSVVEYKRRGASARILTSHGSLDRLRAWLPDVELAVVEERPGRTWVGQAYAYPLRHEFPIGGALDPPAGTIQADVEVGDTGTGIVPLVPGHGPTDAEIAERLGIAGWPLLTTHGTLDPTLMHKYSGLDVETASEFVARDLTEGGSVLARLRVVRGVPYCAICGHRMVWLPGRAWCLEPSRLPPEQKDRYSRLLPNDRPIGQIEVSRWPVSEITTSTDPGAVVLLECARCERLESPEGAIECPCGGTRRRVSRRLLPSVDAAFSAWARAEASAPTDLVRVYANDRRRVPALVHHLTAMTGMEATTAEFGLTLVPTVSHVDLAKLTAAHGADAVRAAFVRTRSAGAGGATFEERCGQEEARLVRFFQRTVSLVALCGPDLLREGAQPPDASARDLEVEDRAILARWARAHVRILAAYDRWSAESAHRLLYRFLEQDLADYVEMTRPRLELAGTPPTKRAAIRTRLYLFRAAAIALAPIAPFTAEAIHRRLVVEGRSLFESVDLGTDRSLADEDRVAAWNRWRSVIEAADGVRRAYQLPATTVLPAVALVLSDEEAADRLRGDRPTLERLARIAKLEVTSPQVPWAARQRRLVPVESEIQRAYPALASQIVHLLERMPPRRSAEASRDVTLFITGVPRTITADMFAAVDTLPEGYAPTPFAGGEMYVQLPRSSDATRPPPPVSPDAFWVVRRLARWLRRLPSRPDAGGYVAIVSTVDPLAAELQEKATAISDYLGLRELRILGVTPEALPRARIQGRTRSGARWSIAIPGVDRTRRPPKHRLSVSDGRRLPPPRAPVGSKEIDFADEKVIAREQSIRDLGRSLDELLEAPVLGPAKVAIAWDAGLQSMDAFRSAPFEQIAQLTGFGRPIASTLWSKLGRDVPPGSARPGHRTASPPGFRARPTPRAAPSRTAPASGASAAAVVVPPPAPSADSQSLAVPPSREPVPVPPPGALVVPEAPREGPAETAGSIPLPPVPEPPSPTEPAIPLPPAPSVAVAEAERGEAAATTATVAEPAPSIMPEPSATQASAGSIASESSAPPEIEEVAPSEPAARPAAVPSAEEAEEEPQAAAQTSASETGPSSPGAGPPRPEEIEEPAAPEGTSLPEVQPGGTSEPAEGSSPEPAAIPSTLAEEAPTPPPESIPTQETEAQPAGQEPIPTSEEQRPSMEELSAVAPATGSSAPEPASVEPIAEGVREVAEEEVEPPSPEIPESPPEGLPEVPASQEPQSPTVEELSSGEPPEAPPPEPRTEPESPAPAESQVPPASPEAEEAPALTEEIVPEFSPAPSEPEAPAEPAEPVPPAPGPTEVAPAEAGESFNAAPEATPSEGPGVPESGPIPPESSAPAPEGEMVESVTASESPEATLPESPLPTPDVPVPAEAPPAESPSTPEPEPAAATPEPTPFPEPPAASGTSPESTPVAEPLPPPEPTSLVPPPSIPIVPEPTPLVPPSPEIAPPAQPAPEPLPSAPPAPVAPPRVEIPPPPAGVEIDASSGLFHALQPFLDATAAGHKGIAIVRELPERIRVHIGPRPVEVFWLTNLPRPRALRPTDLAGLTQRIHQALEEEGITAIFIEGIEYLVGVHGIERVVGFLRDLDTVARARTARIWVHLTPSLVAEKDLDRLMAVGGAASSSG